MQLSKRKFIAFEYSKSGFTKKLSKGWEEEYKEYRFLWNDLPKKRIDFNFDFVDENVDIRKIEII